jgi:GT2 family glycosyltransferase
MAFRKEIFDRYGLFRTDLGPFPSTKIGFEDTEFGRRLMAGGERLYYVPSATVFHEINEARVRKEYFLAWWYDFGRGSVREIGKTLRTWGTLKILARTILTAFQWLLTFGSQRRFYRKCRVWYGAGKIVELFQRATQTEPARAEESID